MTDPGLAGYLILAAFLFACGVLCLATKRNAVGLLMGVELILNAANLNLVASARYVPSLKMDGQTFALLVIVLAAAEAAVALAIFLNFYNNRGAVDVDDPGDLRGVNALFDLTAHPGRAFVLAAMLPLVPVLILATVGLLRNLARGRGERSWEYRLLGGSRPPNVAGYLAIASMLGAAALAGWGYVQLSKQTVDVPGRWAERADWIRIGSLKPDAPAKALQLGYRIDELTALLFGMVCLVGSLIFTFALGYMKGDARFGRFYLYLGLFAASMLNLLVADNLFQVFACWELVGVCSYFLIGFHYERRSAGVAANKAFLMNRVGDAGFLIAIGIAFAHVGTLNIQELIAAFQHGPPSGMGQAAWVAMGLGLFLGCAGKSAQVPLHTWLPDAMEGPTPVSALIHAATMVAAGVYLVGRCYPLFAPSVLLVIAYSGMITALLGATIALVQTDIKRVLAYSTCSQLGFMMLALGVGGWVAGLLHLLTHAFFKALLFLCAGSVIHGCHHAQDLRKMGGLRRKMPVTAFTMLVGVLAICGTPFFSGWYSKDRILAAALGFGLSNPDHLALFLVPLAVAGMTAFYMLRLWLLAFTGTPRDPHVHPHESPLVMTVPLVILALFSLGVAWGWPLWDAGASALGHKLESVQPPLNSPKELRERQTAEHYHLTAEGLALLAAALGAGLAWAKYRKAPTPAQLAEPRGPLAEKWYFDRVYDAAFRRGTVDLAYNTARFDKTTGKGASLDGALTGVATAAGWLGRRVRTVQTGQVRQYVLALALTVAALLGMLTWLTK